MFEKSHPKMDFGALLLVALSMRQRMDLFRNLMQASVQKFQDEHNKAHLSEIKQISCALSQPNRQQYEASIRVHVLVNELYPTYGLESLGATSLLFLENSRQQSPDPFESYDDVLRTKALNHSYSSFSAGEEIDSILLANNISLSSFNVPNSQSRLETELNISPDIVSPISEPNDIVTMESDSTDTPQELSSDKCVLDVDAENEVPHHLLAELTMDDLPASVDSGMFNEEDEEEYCFAEPFHSDESDDYTIPKEDIDGPSEVKLESGDLLRLPSFTAMSSIDSDIFGSTVDGFPSDDFLRQLGGSPTAELDMKPETLEVNEESKHTDLKNEIKMEPMSSHNFYSAAAPAIPTTFSTGGSVGADYSSGQASVSSLSSPTRPVDDFYVSYNRKPTLSRRRDDMSQVSSITSDRRMRLSRRSNGPAQTGRSRVSSLHGASSSIDLENEIRSMSSPRSSQFSQYEEDDDDVESVYSSSNTETTSRKRSRHYNDSLDRGDQSLKDVAFLRGSGVPFTYSEVAYSSNESFRQLRSTPGLSEDKINAMMDARRRATNRKAAERCRQQKNLERDDLATDLDRINDKKREMERQVVKARHRRDRARDNLADTRNHLFSRLRDANNQPFQPDQWRLQFTDQGGIILVPRTDATT